MDGDPHPLDRWSFRVGTAMAMELGGKAFFPFGGPPYQPFLTWAKKAERLNSSMIGMLMHGEYGLWHAYRFAIAFPDEVPMMDVSDNPLMDVCANCIDQPCLTSCPVGAFEKEGYDVESCYRHIDNKLDNSCMNQGCLARRACPQGSEFLYQDTHAQFHMTQFLASMKLRFAE